MGLGNAMYEELKFDKERSINCDPAEYKIATALDAPVKNIVVKSDEPKTLQRHGRGRDYAHNPAILNAVYNAIGARILELPLTLIPFLFFFSVNSCNFRCFVILYFPNAEM